MISSDPPLASLHELDTIYGVEDLYDFLEVLTVNAHNRRLVNERTKRKD